MDQKSIESDIKNYKVREGPIYKRSKFLKEWRDRWLVLTHNFIYTFTSKKMDEATDIIDLKDVKSYKSYLRKDQQMIPAGFKLRTSDDMFYFCAKNCYQKWSWIVSFQRLLDYKCVGATPYNNVDSIKTKGFESQIEFENGGKSQQSAPPPIQVALEKTASEAKKQVDEEAQKIMKKIQEQQKELEKQKEELSKKESSFKEEQRRKEQEEKKKQSQVTQPPPPKPVEKKEEPPREGGSNVANLRNMFESKMTQKSNIPQYDMTKYDSKKPTKKKEDTIHISRSNIVVGLFDEFRAQASQSFGFKYMIDFMVSVAGDQKLGYSPFVIREGKTHENKNVFSEIFIELLMVSENYQECQNLMKFIQTCVFQVPGLFSQEQTALIQKKLKDFFNNVNNEAKLQLIIKNMYIMHKMKNYNKQDIFNKLDKLVKEVKKEETRNWAKKLRDDL